MIAPFIKTDFKDYLIQALEVGRRCIFAVNEKIRESYDAEESNTPVSDAMPYTSNYTSTSPSSEMVMSSSPRQLESTHQQIDLNKSQWDRLIDSGSDADSESSSQNSLESIEGGGAVSPRSFKSAVSSFHSGSTSHYSSRLSMAAESESTEIPIHSSITSRSPTTLSPKRPHGNAVNEMKPESYPWKIPKASSHTFHDSHGKSTTESSVKKFGVYVVQLALILDLKHVGLKNVVRFVYTIILGPSFIINLLSH
jgi:hypothetical protein